MKHLFPSDLIVENEATGGLRRTFAYLEEHGWCQGSSMDAGGGVCVGYALQVVGGGLCSTASKALRRVIGGRGIEAWNDSNSTTFAAVRSVIIEAIGQCRT
jgi:hypothetical protein